MKKHAVMIKKSHFTFLDTNIKVLLLIKKPLILFNDSLTIICDDFKRKKKPQNKLRF